MFSKSVGAARSRPQYRKTLVVTKMLKKQIRWVQRAIKNQNMGVRRWRIVQQPTNSKRATGTFKIVYSANVRCLHIGNKNFVDICLYVDYTMLVQRK
jgi:hypothetical protein